MLFVAKSINYMDRQVIAILKLTLQQGIGLAEIDYGYVVDCLSGGLGAVVGFGGMGGSAGGALFAFFAGHILQFTHSYAILFATAASAYLLGLVILYLFAPGLPKVELPA
jgi:nitrate/nitrite transporter NarK